MSNKELFELTKFENVTAATVFQEGGLDNILAKIKDNVSGFVPNLETSTGRKEIASLAAKVSRSKTYLDGLGKNMVAEWKGRAKVVDGERKRMRDTLDELKAEVRKPLSDWEEGEAKRVAEIEQRIIDLQALAKPTTEGDDSETLAQKIEDLLYFVVDGTLSEYEEEAIRIKESGLLNLNEILSTRIQYESDQAELKRHREAEAKRVEEERAANKKKEQKARDKQLQKEAAEKVKAREKAKREKIERDKQQAIQDKEDAERREKEAAEKAERDRIEAEERAKRDKEAAVEAERKRIADEEAAKEAEAKRRKEDAENRDRVHTDIKSFLIKVFATLCEEEKDAEGIASTILVMLKEGTLPHTSIKY